MTVGILYFASGFSGGVLALAALLGWTGIGIAAALLLLVILVMIAWIADNKIQDWLERCYWGAAAGERYRNLETEMHELSLAIKD